MSGISTTGMGLPSAQSLFSSGATTPAATTPASTIPVAGPTVAGPGGTTTLPSASPADFQGVNPTPLDQPHPQYPTLIQSHVAVLQAIGTPEHIIAQLAQTQPSAEYIDRYIQGEIMQAPEKWDEYVGNPAGTARAGLQQLMPGVQLPAPGAGTPGLLPDGSRVDGVNVPGITQPLAGPQDSAGEGLVKGIAITAAVVGIGLLGWHFLKKRNAGADAAKLLGGDNKNLVANLAGNDGALGGGLHHLMDVVKSGGNGWGKVGEGSAQRLLLYQAAAGGGAPAAGAKLAATLDGIHRGFGPVDGAIHSVGIGAAMHNIPFKDAAAFSLQSQLVDAIRESARLGQGPEMMAAVGMMSQQAAQLGAQAGNANKVPGLQQLFLGAANVLS